MPEPNEFVLWGSAGHAKVMAEAISMIGGQVIALFDNNHDVLSVLPGVPVFKGKNGFLSWIESQGNKKHQVSGLAAIGGGRGFDRLKIQSLFQEYGLLVPVLRHPAATVSPSVFLGAGTQVLALSNIAAGSTLGDACIVNHKASVDHECRLGNGVHVGPGATLCGCVLVADNVFIGAGAIVLPRISIGENSVIGAGAVVTKDVSPNTTLIGNPAKPIHTNKVK
jgi:sugar O-acyltransferase (sialic acid O-acetyltransferase NeuD family)